MRHEIRAEDFMNALRSPLPPLSVLAIAVPTLCLLHASPVRAGDWLGVLFSRETVDLAARRDGEILEVIARPGDRVSRGERLLLLGDEELGGQLGRAAAELKAGRAALEQALSASGELHHLLERRQAAPEIFSRDSIESLLARTSRADAEVTLREARVDEATVALRQLEERRRALDVRSPVDGAVVAVRFDVGGRVAAGETLIRVRATDDLWVRFAVPADDVSGLRVGRLVRVAFENDARRIEGTVQHIAPEVDWASDAVFVEALLEVPSSPETRPGSGSAVTVGWVTPEAPRDPAPSSPPVPTPSRRPGPGIGR
jgi:RND family efflux transporter MFP subunit